MIKFFRKIRQNLLNENKFKKYLIYVIGEITLVVIGILIALTINNSNQSKINKNNASLIFNQIQKDLILDINWMEIKIDFINSNLIILNNVSTGNYNDKDIINLYTPLTFNFNTRNYSRSYQNLEKTGGLQYVNNIELMNSLQDYYLVITARLNDIIGYHRQLNITSNEGELIHTLNISKGGVLDLTSTKDQIENGSLRSLINVQLVYGLSIKQQMETTIIQAEKLKKLIETSKKKTNSNKTYKQ